MKTWGLYLTKLKNIITCRPVEMKNILGGFLDGGEGLAVSQKMSAAIVSWLGNVSIEIV